MWKQWEVDFLRENYDTMGLKGVSKSLKRSVESVRCKKYNLQKAERCDSIESRLLDLTPTKGIELLRTRLHLPYEDAVRKYWKWRKRFLITPTLF